MTVCNLLRTDVIDFASVAPLNTETHSLHIRVRAFAAFCDESVNPRGDNEQPATVGKLTESRARAPLRPRATRIPDQMRC
jgi:hypothetical protein